MEFEAVIGLEIHAQLKTDSKIFCGCSTKFGAPPNAQTCPVCLGMPGVLPVVNKKAIEYAIRAGLAMGCVITRDSRFARKNYFYPDLPLGYQITQFDLPIAENGWLDIDLDSGIPKRIGITRIHMENDAGKSTHDPTRPLSHINLNRAGIPLIEIVTEPDLRSAEEAGVLMRQIHAIVRYIDVCDGNMEEGSLRCDANVSLRRKGETKFGTRTEMKNLNSFRNIEKAIQYEINRQEGVLEEGGIITQETRLWNADTQNSTPMRSKEDAHDYRYFPDPDLLPMVIDDDWLDTIRQTIPELPNAKKKRYMEELELPETDAAVLTSSIDIASYFEECLSYFNQPKQVGNWIMVSLLGLLNAEGKSIEKSPISARALADLLILVDTDLIHGTAAKKVFEIMAVTEKDPKTIAEEEDLISDSDESALESLVAKILEANPKEVEAFKSGKKKLMGFFVGQIMRETKGKANPKIVNQLLNTKLSE